MHVPIETVSLFPILDEKLISLLKDLSAEDWDRPTRAKLWTVKDVATHLLDGNIRTLSISRDNYFGEVPDNVNSYQDLVRYLDRLNADWVSATKRISPRLLIDLLDATGKQFCEHLRTLDPFQPAIFSVAWAGESTSRNWFHIAREYTEKWHHQQQIREAVGRLGIEDRQLYHPVLATFIRAIPHNLRCVKTESGLTVQIVITGKAGGEWFFQFDGETWFSTTLSDNIVCKVTLPDTHAWKLFTKGLSTQEKEHLIKIEGDKTFAQPVISSVAIMG
jgi:uncharacterized protein (TIGR03083 family)